MDLSCVSLCALFTCRKYYYYYYITSTIIINIIIIITSLLYYKVKNNTGMVSSIRFFANTIPELEHLTSRGAKMLRNERSGDTAAGKVVKKMQTAHGSVLINRRE